MQPAQVPAEQKAHSQKLLNLIQQTIKQARGWLSFERYMQMALYTPGLGYYSGHLAKLGAQGDFITAPEMGDLFAACLAVQTAQVLNELEGGGSVLEFGAGSGALAAAMLKQLEALDALPKEYLILELSGDLRARQQQTLRECAPRHAARVKWLDALPQGMRGVVVANEVLDAMPVRLFEQRASGQIGELGLACSREHRDTLVWQSRPADAQLIKAVEALDLDFDAALYRSEMAFQAPAWVRSLGGVLEQGAVLLIDYGFPRSEYYHPDRDRGTLMCHYHHGAHGDPLFMPGLQDITAHVEFTAIATAAKRAGFELAGYTTQGAFLLGTGLLDRIPLDASAQQQLELAQQIKKLTLPHEMGELFKVLALTRHFDAALCGFASHNQVYKLEQDYG